MLAQAGDVYPVTGAFSDRFAGKLPRGVNGLIIAFAIVGPILFATLGAGLSLFALLPLIIVAVGAFLAWRAYDRGLSGTRSEEHTSELQSRGHLVCRLLLEKKKRIRCQ